MLTQYMIYWYIQSSYRHSSHQIKFRCSCMYLMLLCPRWCQSPPEARPHGHCLKRRYSDCWTWSHREEEGPRGHGRGSGLDPCQCQTCDCDPASGRYGDIGIYRVHTYSCRDAHFKLEGDLDTKPTTKYP